MFLHSHSRVLSALEGNRTLFSLGYEVWLYRMDSVFKGQAHNLTVMPLVGQARSIWKLSWANLQFCWTICGICYATGKAGTSFQSLRFWWLISDRKKRGAKISAVILFCQCWVGLILLWDNCWDIMHCVVNFVRELESFFILISKFVTGDIFFFWVLSLVGRRIRSRPWYLGDRQSG